LRAQAAAKNKFQRAEAKLRHVERQRQIAELEAVSLQRWEKAQAEQAKVLAMKRAAAKAKKAEDAARLTAYEARLARAAAARQAEAEAEAHLRAVAAAESARYARLSAAQQAAIRKTERDGRRRERQVQQVAKAAADYEDEELDLRPQLRSELEPMRLTALQRRAVEAGVSDDVLDDALDSDDPKASLTAAIVVAAAEAAQARAAARASHERAQLERAKKIAARGNRRAAAARVSAARAMDRRAELKAKKHQDLEERERRAGRRARAQEHRTARRLMEEQWDQAKTQMVQQQQTQQPPPPLHADESLPMGAEGLRTVDEADVSGQEEQQGLCAQAAALLESLGPTVAIEDAKEDEISEEERAQMEGNADNIDFEMLNEKGSILTLVKYTIVASVRPVICRQLELIAGSEEDAPEPEQHRALLSCLLEMIEGDESSSVCAAEALHALEAAVAWPARIAEQQAQAAAAAAAERRAAEELQELQENLARIASERAALEAERDDLAATDGAAAELEAQAAEEPLQMELRQQEAAEARRKLGNGMSARRSLLALDQTY
jgi:hypothetical protein